MYLYTFLQAHHSMCFSTACLSIGEYSAIIALYHTLDQFKSTILIYFFLLTILPKNRIELKSFCLIFAFNFDTHLIILWYINCVLEASFFFFIIHRSATHHHTNTFFFILFTRLNWHLLYTQFTNSILILILVLILVYKNIKILKYKNIIYNMNNKFDICFINKW